MSGSMGDRSKAGLSRTVRWYLDNEPWWRTVTDARYRDWLARQYGM